MDACERVSNTLFVLLPFYKVFVRIKVDIDVLLSKDEQSAEI